MLAPRDAYSGTEARHLRRIDGRLVAKIIFTAKVLPVGIFHPAIHDLLVRHPVSVLQIMQTAHQPDRHPWPPRLGVQRSELIRQPLPLDPIGQPTQLKAQIQQVHQLHAKQIALWCRARLDGAHQNPPAIAAYYAKACRF